MDKLFNIFNTRIEINEAFEQKFTNTIHMSNKLASYDKHWNDLHACTFCLFRVQYCKIAELIKKFPSR